MSIQFEFKDIICKDAMELLNYLSPYHEIWGDYYNPQMRFHIFRGQANADWVLKPVAWRNIDSQIEEIKNYGVLYNRTIRFIESAFESQQQKFYKDFNFEFLEEPTRKINLNVLLPCIYGVFDKILNFITLSNKLGLHTPSFSQISKFQSPFSFLNYYLHILLAKFPDQTLTTEEIWESDGVALAQHHGIPTPLLDWTYNPKKALFFAINDEKNISENIAVFALPHLPYNPSFKIINVATNYNSFLRTQEGLFTYYTLGDIYFLDKGIYPSLEESIGDVDFGYGYKFIISKSHIEELKHRLSAEEIHLASLMPTYDNIAYQIMKKNWQIGI